MRHFLQHLKGAVLTSSCRNNGKLVNRALIRRGASRRERLTCQPVLHGMGFNEPLPLVASHRVLSSRLPW